MSTTNYSFNLPTVGGSEDTWGTQLNANWTALDTLLGGVTTSEFSYLDGVTSPLQTQINAKANNANASIATSISLTGGANAWQFALSGNDLIIKYGATTLARLDTSGNLTVVGNVTAFGTI